MNKQPSILDKAITGVLAGVMVCLAYWTGKLPQTVAKLNRAINKKGK